jgi:hypothetical protein
VPVVPENPENPEKPLMPEYPDVPEAPPPVPEKPETPEKPRAPGSPFPPPPKGNPPTPPGMHFLAISQTSWTRTASSGSRGGPRWRTRPPRMFLSRSLIYLLDLVTIETMAIAAMPAKATTPRIKYPLGPPSA